MVGLGMRPELKRPTGRSRFTQKGKYRLICQDQAVSERNQQVAVWCYVGIFSAFNLGPFVMVLPDDGYKCPIVSLMTGQSSH